MELKKEIEEVVARVTRRNQAEDAIRSSSELEDETSRIVLAANELTDETVNIICREEIADEEIEIDAFETLRLEADAVAERARAQLPETEVRKSTS